MIRNNKLTSVFMWCIHVYTSVCLYTCMFTCVIMMSGIFLYRLTVSRLVSLVNCSLQTGLTGWPVSSRVCLALALPRAAAVTATVPSLLLGYQGSAHRFSKYFNY